VPDTRDVAEYRRIQAGSMRLLGCPRMKQIVPMNSLSDSLASCIFCAASMSSRNVARVQDEPPVDVVECSECRAQMVNRLPQRDFLDRLYTADYSGHLEASKRLSNALARRISGEIADSWPPPDCVRILDFGGGTGAFALALGACLSEKSLRFQVTVVDIVPGRVGDHIQYFDPEAFDKTNQQFDIILCSAVVEHLRDPGFRLTSLFDRLAMGGWIYVRSPQLGWLKVIKPSWFRWPRHLSDFGPAFWRRFPMLAGWDITVVWSRACRPETEWRLRPVATAVAYVLKAPCFVELGIRRLLRRSEACVYPMVGGWEFLARKLAEPRSR